MHTRFPPNPALGRATFDSARYSALLPDATVTGISPSRPLSSQFPFARNRPHLPCVTFGSRHAGPLHRRSDVLHPHDLEARIQPVKVHALPALGTSFCAAWCAETRGQGSLKQLPLFRVDFVSYEQP
jgi:hypothetical protein